MAAGEQSRAAVEKVRCIMKTVELERAAHMCCVPGTNKAGGHKQGSRKAPTKICIDCKVGRRDATRF